MTQRLLASGILLFAATCVAAQEAPYATAPDHVPPNPPQDEMRDMSNQDMVSMMQMDDAHPFGKVMLDQLEWRDARGGGAGAWDAEGWYGGDYDKLWVKTEGERVAGITRDASVDLLFDHVVGRWWEAQAGVRQDFGNGPARTWLALGLQGLAPDWLDVETTLYVGEEGRVAARLKADYDLLITQRLILQPYGEANFYSKSDPARRVSSGLSDLQLSLRLRYEIRREVAPYLGIEWLRRFGDAAQLARAAGEENDAAELVAGLHIWF